MLKYLKRAVKNCAALGGYELSPVRRPSAKHKFESPFLDPSCEEEYRDICTRIHQSGTRITRHLPMNYTVYQAIKYVVENDIPGDIIECGVAAGIKMRIVCEFLAGRGISDRPIYLYDTYTGMTQPGEYDIKMLETLPQNAEETMRTWQENQRDGFNRWCYASLDEVRRNIALARYAPENVFYVAGDVCQTIPNDFHHAIAFLRLDTDFYESSKHELEQLYDLVPLGGVVIFDDYGSWAGQKRAVDEFFAARDMRPFLARTCRQERVHIKYFP